ncbi:MAG: hypothetical protein JNL80_01300 [Phycisphaerae bacterium]|jgi:hypothetical protein|nr:hypothetical protein [Phycisphaerae bacterium]
MHPTNAHRARRFRAAIRCYGTDDTFVGSLTDLLADARHWCDWHGESFAAIDRRAHQIYLAEVESSGRVP